MNLRLLDLFISRLSTNLKVYLTGTVGANYIEEKKISTNLRGSEGLTSMETVDLKSQILSTKPLEN